MSYKSKIILSFIGFWSLIVSVCGQDQKVADSLVSIYKADTVQGPARLALLRDLSFNEVRDLRLSLQYAEELIALSKQQGDNHFLACGYLQKGNNKRLLGDLDEALASFFKCVEAANKAKFVEGEGSAYVSIADIYSINHNHINAMLYYHKAIATIRQSGDPLLLAGAVSNAGDEFFNNRNYDSALFYFRESGTIYEKVNNLTGKGYSLGNIGMVYANTGQAELAEKNINEAIRILETQQDYYPICVYLISMSDIFLKKRDATAALNYAKRSLKLAQQYGLKGQIGEADLKLSELYEKAGNKAESFTYYKDYIVYRDSLNNIQSVQKMADLRTDYEVSRKQVQVDLLNQQRKNQRIMVISLFIILGLTTVILATFVLVLQNHCKREEKI